MIEEANIGIVDVAFGELHSDPADAHINWDSVFRRIREAALELGVDLYDIAEFLGLDPRAADYRERVDSLPKMKTAMQVAAFLGVPAAWVLVGKGQPKHRLVNDLRSGIHNTADSTVLQGNTAGTMIINQGGSQISDQKRELNRIFDRLPVREQTKLLNYAYQLEEAL